MFTELTNVILLIERYEAEYQEQLSVQHHLETLIDENNSFYTKIKKHDEIKTRLQNLEIDKKRITNIIETLREVKHELEKQLFEN